MFHLKLMRLICRLPANYSFRIYYFQQFTVKICGSFVRETHCKQFRVQALACC